MGLASPSHLIIVLVLILLLFGAKKIPELARGLGQGMKEFKAGVNDNDNEIGSKDDSRDRKDENMVNSAASSSTSDSTDERRRETDSV